MDQLDLLTPDELQELRRLIPRREPYVSVVPPCPECGKDLTDRHRRYASPYFRLRMHRAHAHGLKL